MTTLHRTFGNRQTFYNADGQGRDSYIIHRALRKSKVSSTNSSPVRSCSPKDPKAQNYVPNGTGRDSYISFSSSGQYSGHATKNFYHSLREPILRDPFSKTQVNWLRKRKKNNSIENSRLLKYENSHSPGKIFRPAN